jgi:N-acyl amino acid synthase of PEP-CTERM/exosortase system
MPTDAPASFQPESEITSFAAKDRREEHAGRPQRLIDAFSEDFVCINADEPWLRDVAYRIRYAVYCLDNSFEDPAANPNGRESDEFDDHAPHKLLVHRASGTIAGVVRLILPEPDQPNYGLPFNALVGQLMPIDKLAPSAEMAEASRFAIARQFRDFVRRTGLLTDKPKLLAQEALLRNASIGLMRAIVEMAAEHGMTHLCAVMEPALLRLLARLGVHFHPIGPMIEHHGRRQPCFVDLDKLLARTWAERRDVWEVLTATGSLWPLSRLYA